MLFRTNFGVLHYDLVGPDDGAVVCMLHSLTSDAGMWAEQVPALLGAGYRVLRLNARGHGGSSPGGDRYTMEQLAGDVISVLDHLGIDTVHVIGLSMGGMKGQVLAADHPDRVRSLMACATNARWTGDAGMMRGRIDTVRAHGSLEPIVDQSMEQRYSDALRQRRPQRWAALRETYLATSLDGYYGCMHAVLDHDVLGRLATVRAPVLVVSGSDDPVTPPAAGKEIAAAVKGARYEEIAGGRHLFNVEFEQQFNRLMLQWLASVEG